MLVVNEKIITMNNGYLITTVICLLMVMPVIVLTINSSSTSSITNANSIKAIQFNIYNLKNESNLAAQDDSH